MHISIFKRMVVVYSIMGKIFGKWVSPFILFPVFFWQVSSQFLIQSRCLRVVSRCSIFLDRDLIIFPRFFENNYQFRLQIFFMVSFLQKSRIVEY